MEGSFSPFNSWATLGNMDLSMFKDKIKNVNVRMDFRSPRNLEFYWA